MTLEVADAEAPRVLGSAGDSHDGRRFLWVDHDVVELLLAGTPTELRAWAERVIVLAEDLATADGGNKGAGDE
jgi:hypothetical protein